MALVSLTNAKILVGPADVSGHSNKIDMQTSAEELDATVFSSGGWKSLLGGMKDVTAVTNGFWEAADATFPDDQFFAGLGVRSIPMTVTPTGATVGDVSYFTQIMVPKYAANGEVGQLFAFSADARGDGTSLVRGVVADNSTRTSTGTTTVQSLVVPSATTRVFAAIHVLAVSGGSASLTATLQGDNAIGFPSPATVVAGSAMTAVGAQFLTGPVGVTADSYYRLSYVISGSSPSFTVIASIGVAA